MITGWRVETRGDNGKVVDVLKNGLEVVTKGLGDVPKGEEEPKPEVVPKLDEPKAVAGVPN